MNPFKKTKELQIELHPMIFSKGETREQLVPRIKYFLFKLSGKGMNVAIKIDPSKIDLPNIYFSKTKDRRVEPMRYAVGGIHRLQI